MFPTKPPITAIVAGDTQREEVALERERGEEGQEPDGAAHHGHGAAGEQDARLVQLLPFELGLPAPICRIRTRGNLRARIPPITNTTVRESQRPFRPEELLHEATAGTPPTVVAITLDEREPRVRADELVRIVDERGNERALGHRVALGEDQDPERERVHEQTRRAPDRRSIGP